MPSCYPVGRLIRSAHPLSDRMTLTDIAAHVGTNRVTMYRIVQTVGFPRRAADKRWSRTEVLAWLADNTKPADAVMVAGILIRQGEPA